VERSVVERVARFVLGGLTLLLMASMGGGFLLLPLLVPGHVWAARRSNPVARIRWSVLPAASLGMVTWAAVYAAVGESKPAIWLLPTLVTIGTLAAVIAFAVRPAPPALAPS
jgi:hypothetical protein